MDAGPLQSVSPKCHLITSSSESNLEKWGLVEVRASNIPLPGCGTLSLSLVTSFSDILVFLTQGAVPHIMLWSGHGRKALISRVSLHLKG